MGMNRAPRSSPSPPCQESAAGPRLFCAERGSPLPTLRAMPASNFLLAVAVLARRLHVRPIELEIRTFHQRNDVIHRVSAARAPRTLNRAPRHTTIRGSRLPEHEQANLPPRTSVPDR